MQDVENAMRSSCERRETMQKRQDVREHQTSFDRNHKLPVSLRFLRHVRSRNSRRRMKRKDDESKR